MGWSLWYTADFFPRSRSQKRQLAFLFQNMSDNRRSTRVLINTNGWSDLDSPRNMLAVSRPMSDELSSRSQRAVGRRKDTQRISTASLALAQPHTSSSSQWNKPNPERSTASKQGGRLSIERPLQKQSCAFSQWRHQMMFGIMLLWQQTTAGRDQNTWINPENRVTVFPQQSHIE